MRGVGEGAYFIIRPSDLLCPPLPATWYLLLSPAPQHTWEPLFGALVVCAFVRASDLPYSVTLSTRFAVRSAHFGALFSSGMRDSSQAVLTSHFGRAAVQAVLNWWVKSLGGPRLRRPLMRGGGRGC